MYAAISLIHAQQVAITAMERALKPLGLTFARYEILMLLSFTRAGALPITKVGERLLVHPTGITRLVDKLEANGLVTRTTNPADRRGTLARITPAGRRLARRATTVLSRIHYGVDLAEEPTAQLIDALQALRDGSKPRRGQPAERR